MKIKDLIKVTNCCTDLLIVSPSKDCAWSSSEACDHECSDCNNYSPVKSDFIHFKGRADLCPIKLSDMTVKEIHAQSEHRRQAVIKVMV